MAYKLAVSKQVAKFLDKSDKKLRAKIITTFELLAQEPFSENLDAKPLVNRQGHFRLRISKFRFLYEITDSELFMFIKPIVVAMCINKPPYTFKK